MWANRDTSSGGFERNDEGERAATAKGYLAMRAATREKMISIMAEAGLAGGLSAANRKLPETGLEEMSNDLPEADFWPAWPALRRGHNSRVARYAIRTRNATAVISQAQKSGRWVAEGTPPEIGDDSFELPSSA